MTGIAYGPSNRERSRTLKTVIAVLMWLISCSAGGLLIALLWNEFGSIVAVFGGMAIGCCGALASAIASVLQHYRLLVKWHIGVVVWALTMATFCFLELVWKYAIRDFFLASPIVALVAAPLSYSVARIYATRTKATSAL